MGVEGNVVGNGVESGLIDTGAPEIPADGVDHIEIVGPIVKWVFYSVRWGPDGQPQRREQVTVSMPLDNVQGGVKNLRERFYGKIREVHPQTVEETPRRLELN